MIPKSLIIAVDFDGTIVEDKYPAIGKPMPFAFNSLKMLQKDGHRLILWTYRVNDKLKEAVEFCRENGVEFYAVNASFPEENLNDGQTSRKIHADLFIDDRNFGGFPGWGVIYQKISGQDYPADDANSSSKSKKKGGFFKFGR